MRSPLGDVDPSFTFVADAFVLVWTAVEDSSGFRVAFEPGLADLEFAAAPDCSDAMATSGVLRHAYLLNSDFERYGFETLYRYRTIRCFGNETLRRSDTLDE